MFKKIVFIEGTGINQWSKNKIKEFGDIVEFYDDLPKDNKEIIERIGDADCVMVSYTTPIEREVIESCENIKYIGMCCSLYDEKSANVDILAAKERGITVLGVKDYGDEGTVEYAISELVRLLHGFGEHQWKERPNELTNQKIGIFGLGKTGLMLAEALKLFGADVYYYSRSRKEDAEAKGIKYLPVDEFLQEVDIISTHLPKNTIALDEEKFKLFGNGKIIVNTSIGATFDVDAMEKWLQDKSNFYLCDQVGMGDCVDRFKDIENVIFINKVAASSKECTKRLSRKVIENVEYYLNNIKNV